MALPDKITINGRDIPILEFMLLPCQTKEDLRLWIDMFLGINFPDAIIAEGSNSSPMDMIWWTYQKCVLDKESKVGSRALFMASRSSYKTLAASVVELLAIIHGNRDVAHIGAIEAQAKRCYNYFTKYMWRDILKGLLQSDPTMQKSIFKSGRTIECLPCTINSVNSPHVSCVCLDEADTVKDMQAYRDISGIPSPTIDGRPPVEIIISTRKSLYGIIQQEMDKAHLTGMQIFSWNIIDITKRCPDERSGIQKIPIYVNFDSLEAISEAQWKLRPITEQKKFQCREGFEGCLNRCKLFASCLGCLKRQTCDSPLLHEIDYAQEKILSVPVDWANAQLLCRKPSTEGTIYPTFVYADHVKSYSEMYEIFTGEKPARQLDFDMLRHEFEKRGMRPYMAVDFGEHLAAALLFYVDGKDFVYVIKEQTFTATDDHELALWLKQNWGGYGVQLVFPDIANPSGIRLLIKQGFPCSKKVDKDINAGISTVRSFFRIPGTNRPRIAIHEDCKNLIWELPRYHRKKMPNEQFSEDPDDINNHSADGLRYFLHTVFGMQSAMVSSADTGAPPKPVKTQEGNFVKVPTAQELAQHLGRNDFVDNSDLFNEDGSEKKDGGNEGPAGGGFQWSW